MKQRAVVLDEHGKPCPLSEQAIREAHARNLDLIRERAREQEEWLQQRERLWGKRPTAS